MFDLLPGIEAARTTLAGCLFLSAVLAVTASRLLPAQSGTWSRRAAPLLPPMLAGIVFLAPLLIANERGFFSINGGDFGSHGGWAEYFQDKTVRDSPPDPPINMSKSGFANLIAEVSQPRGKWRIGNITYFTAVKALTFGDWHTNYMVSVALLMAMLTAAVGFAATEVFRLPESGARFCAYSFLAANTLFWLGSAHYVPNIAGLALVIALAALIFRALRARSWGSLPAAGLLVAAAFLHYPEAFPYSLLFFGLAFLAQVRRRSAWAWAAGFCAFVAAMAYMLTPVVFPYLWRHLVAIAGYDRPGDFVGIYYWSYPLQYLGVLDYDKALRSKPDSWSTADVVAVTTAAGLAVAFLLRALLPDRGRWRRLPFGLSLAVLLLPMARFAWTLNLVPLWKTVLYVSPFVFQLVLIGALLTLRAGARRGPWHPGFAAVTLFLAACAWFRVDMVRRIVVGDVHAAIWGNDYLALHERIGAIFRGRYDAMLVAYEGSGTYQAAWEWLLQDYPYAFATHGTGVNEFDPSALDGKRLLIVDDGAPRFHYVNGRVDYSPPVARFGATALYDPTRSTFLLPLSSSWSYIPRNGLGLRGLPALLAVWSGHPQRCDLQMTILMPRNPGVLVAEHNGVERGRFPVPMSSAAGLAAGPTLVTFPLVLKHGLNVIRLRSEPPVGVPLAPEAVALGRLRPVDPFVGPSSAAWGRSWNLVTPPDEPGYPPQFCFSRINLQLYQ